MQTMGYHKQKATSATCQQRKRQQHNHENAFNLTLLGCGLL